jgi:hypothetical protein
MDPNDLLTQSFIIKIWTEAADTGESVWRGQITHVMSGEEFTFQNMNEVHHIIRPYLQDLGIDENDIWFDHR